MFYSTVINATLNNWTLTSLTNGTEMFAAWNNNNYGATINASLAGLDLSGITNGAEMFKRL